MVNDKAFHVVIAGGGFAALEAAVALRALAEDLVRLTVIAPGSSFAYRPAATGEAFADRPPRSYDLAALLRGVGADHVPARLVSVSSEAKSVRLSSGPRLGYDALVLALGARSLAGVAGASTFRDQRDVPKLRRLLAQARSRGPRRLIFAVPAQHSWSLPAYELALQASGPDLDVTLATPERAPLDVFGDEAAAVVADVLSEHSVRFVGAVNPRAVSRHGSLELEFEAALPADGVIAIPKLRGQRIPGIPASWLGFIPTDALGRVEGLRDVYAAGDLTTFPVKQGGLATQDADRIAHTIASRLGATVHALRPARILQARLLCGERHLFLRAELDEFGQAMSPVIERLKRGEAPDDAKVLARYLTPYLAAHEPAHILRAA